MLAKNNSKTSFDQFLFSHFDLKTRNESVRKTDSCDVKETVVNKEEKFTSLKEAIDSIPEKVKSMNIEELTHKHESEWYHTFKDLQEEIATDLAKKHPNYHGVLKLKSEIKEFWEQLDEHIGKAMLELERIFQAFPNVSRVALIYLLSIIIAVPLVFFSANQNDRVSVDSVVNNKTVKAQSRTIEFTKEMKSDYIAKNSEEIISGGKTFIQVTEGIKSGRVAGVYEDAETNLIGSSIKRKISAYYSYLTGLRDEFGYFVKYKLGG